MKTIFANIKKMNILETIISLDVLLFVFAKILVALKVFSFLSVALPFTVNDFKARFWTLLTYGFFHISFVDLFVNMLMLFYFGSIFLDFASPKKFKQIFITAVIFGGIFFLGSYQLLPDAYVVKTPLLGASAGLMGIVTYISLRMPQYQIKIRFIGYIKLIHILIFFLVLNLLQLPLGNPGGYFAHLGGLAIGFMFFVVDKHYATKNTITYKNTHKKQSNSSEIDAILDKIRQSGYESLSDEEKAFLFKQSDKH